MLSQAGSDVMSSEVNAYSRLPISVQSGDGCYLTATDGRVFVDLYGGHAVAALGYGNPGISEAVQGQFQQLEFQSNAVHVPIREQAIAMLVSLAPSHFVSAFLVNSGTEAIENALRLAFLKTGRKRITAVRGAFHGRTAAAAAITDHSESWYGFPGRPFEVDWVTPESFSDLDLFIVDDTAAFIFEPVQGVAGAVDLSPSFAQKAAEICRDRGALLIADEVQTGVGRTGTLWAVEQLGVQPDMMTLAKGLGGGFPVSAVLCTSEIAELVSPGKLGTTFGGGPIACAAMLAVLKQVSQPEFLYQVRENAAYLRETCLSAGVAKVSGRGFLMGLHLDQPAAPVRKHLFERGYLTGDAKNPSVIRLLPPLILDREPITGFGNVLAEVLK